MIMPLEEIASIPRWRSHEAISSLILRLTGLKLGYLLNFGEALMKDGIVRIVNGELD